MQALILLGIVLALGIAAAVGVHQVRRRVRAFSRSAFGTASLGEGLRRQADLLAEQPKSVSSTTRIDLPRIQADFPQFAWAQFRQQGENLLRAALMAIDAGRVDDLGELAGEELICQLTQRVAENQRQGIRERFAQICVHRTEIAGYVKRRGTCVVTLQSAVGCRYTAEQAGKLLRGDRERMTQTKFNLELTYVQDARRADRAGGAAGVTCPHCGAPITSLGEKTCAYCGAALVEINLRVWRFTRLEQLD